MSPDATPTPPFAPTRVRGLVFDLDGTLVDSYAAIGTSLNHARQAFGRPPVSDAEIRRSVGHGLESLIERFLDARDVAVGVRLFRERYAQVFRDQTLALPGVGQTLARLHLRGYRMSVASNKPACFGGPIVAALGWAPLFDCVEGPDSAGTTKPEPTMLRRCLRRMGVSAEEALYVGDMALDAVTGRNAGVAVVLVQGGSASATELELTGEKVLTGLEDLLSLLPG